RALPHPPHAGRRDAERRRHGPRERADHPAGARLPGRAWQGGHGGVHAPGVPPFDGSGLEPVRGRGATHRRPRLHGRPAADASRPTLTACYGGPRPLPLPFPLPLPLALALAWGGGPRRVAGADSPGLRGAVAASAGAGAVAASACRPPDSRPRTASRATSRQTCAGRPPPVTRSIGALSSLPTHTPTATSPASPTNQASRWSCVVPVLPNTGSAPIRAALPVPSFALLHKRSSSCSRCPT